MGKFHFMIIFNSFLMLNLYYLGYMSSDTNLLSYLLSPHLITTVIIAVIIAAITVGFVPSVGFFAVNLELAATSAVFASISVLILSIYALFTTIQTYVSTEFAILICSPLLLYNAIVTFDWWRGRDA